MEQNPRDDSRGQWRGPRQPPPAQHPQHGQHADWDLRGGHMPGAPPYQRQETPSTQYSSGLSASSMQSRAHGGEPWAQRAHNAPSQQDSYQSNSGYRMGVSEGGYYGSSHQGRDDRRQYGDDRRQYGDDRRQYGERERQEIGGDRGFYDDRDRPLASGDRDRPRGGGRGGYNQPAGGYGPTGGYGPARGPPGGRGGRGAPGEDWRAGGYGGGRHGGPAGGGRAGGRGGGDRGGAWGGAPAPEIEAPLPPEQRPKPAPKGSMERKARMEGRLGQGIMVLANHFRVALDPSRLKLNRYSVTFNPVTTSVAMLLPEGGQAGGAADAPLSLRTARSLKREEARAVVAALATQLGLAVYAYDGGATLVTPEQLPDPPTPDGWEVGAGRRRVMVVAQHAGRVDLGGAAAALLALQHVQAQGAQGGAAAAGRVEQALGPEELQALSIIVRSALASQPGITLRGNCCYMPLLRTRPEEQLPGGAKAVPGFSATLGVSMRGLTLAVDGTYTVGLSRQTLPEFMAALLGRSLDDLKRRPLAAHEFKELKRALNGVVVTTHEQIDRQLARNRAVMSGSSSRSSHEAIKCRKMKVHDLDKKPPTHYMFERNLPDGSTVETSVAQYFAEQYKWALEFPLLPCIHVNPKGKRANAMPAEVLMVTEQFRRAKPDPAQVQQLIKVANKAPNLRRQDILDALERHSGMLLRDSPCGRVLSEFGIQVGKEGSDGLMQVAARVLAPPELAYKDDVVRVKEDRTWMLGRGPGQPPRQLLSPGAIRSWAVLVMCDMRDDRALTAFLATMTQAVRDVGIQLPGSGPRSPPIMHMHMGGTVKDALAGALQQARQAYGVGGPAPRGSQGGGGAGVARDLVLVVLQKRKTDAFYQPIKYAGDVELGVATQVVTVEGGVSQGQANKREQYCRNVALKVNQKVGGVNHAIHTGGGAGAAGSHTRGPQPAAGGAGGGGGADVEGADDAWLPQPLRGKKVMLLGIDVNHDSAALPSVAAIVASVDPKLTKYCGELIAQPPRTEVLDAAHMTAAVEQLAYQYMRRNLVPPDVVVVYRDGIGEGQADAVLRNEYTAIREALKDANDEAAIVFISVQKRHNTRVMPATKPGGRPEPGADRGGAKNVTPGTVVEALGAPGAMDCILVSQKGLQGTSRGARYVVLTDEVGLTADEIQRLTFWNCFLYGRCTLPISVPPPVYHADRLAMRGRQLLSAQYGEEASDVASVGSGGAGCSDQAGGGVVLGRIPISAALVDSMFFA